MPRVPHADLLPLDIGAPDEGAADILAAVRRYANQPVGTREDRIHVLRGLRHIQHAATQALLAHLARAQYLQQGHVPLPDAADVTGYSKDSVQHQARVGRYLLTGHERVLADAEYESRRGRGGRPRAANNGRGT